MTTRVLIIVLLVLPKMYHTHNGHKHMITGIVYTKVIRVLSSRRHLTRNTTHTNLQRNVHTHTNVMCRTCQRFLPLALCEYARHTNIVTNINPTYPGTHNHTGCHTSTHSNHRANGSNTISDRNTNNSTITNTKQHS